MELQLIENDENRAYVDDVGQNQILGNPFPDFMTTIHALNALRYAALTSLSQPQKCGIYGQSRNTKR